MVRYRVMTSKDSVNRKRDFNAVTSPNISVHQQLPTVSTTVITAAINY